MVPTTPCDTGRDFEDAARLLAGKIENVLIGRKGRELPDGGAAIRLQVGLPPLDVLEWLSEHNHPTRVYWRDRDGSFEAAGVGVACEVVAATKVDPVRLFERLHVYLSGSDAIRFYGGMAFNLQASRPTDRDWIGFPRCRFVLPRFELCTRNDATYLACHLVPDHDSNRAGEILEQLRELTALARQKPGSLPQLTERVDTPDEARWHAMVDVALDAIEHNTLDKIVLARKSSLRFADRVDPLLILKRWRPSSSGCYHFCFQVTESAFVGASPEKLFRRRHDVIESEALAGTRPRGVSEEDDETLARELLASSKDVREQEYVADHVAEVLDRLCRGPVDRGPRHVEKLAGVQHLCTSFTGQLNDSISNGDIIQALHPTPAVAGAPIHRVLERLLKLEPFDRGWYAGPVGWVGRDSAEFAVGIRSALIGGSRMHAYTGAGIVAGSHPEAEWQEIENKLDNLLKVVESS